MTKPQLGQIARSLRQSAFPKKLAVEICADCNLACTMCHHPFMRRPKGNMPMELWIRCADQVAAEGPAIECWFSFCGEPLMKPELLAKMIRYGKSIGLRSVNVNTNGMLLTAGVGEMLLDSGVDLVVFGIDGLLPETYERIRVGGKHAIVYGNIERFLEARTRRGAGPEIQVQFIEMDENEREQEDFKAYWLERGATVKVRNKLSWGGKFETPLCVPQEDRIPCPWAVTMMHVFWDGRVPRCPGDTEGEESAGNAWDEPLEVLWTRLGRYRQLHLEYRFSELPDRCQACKDWMTGAAERFRPGSDRARAAVA